MFRPRRVAFRLLGGAAQRRTLIDRKLFELPPMPNVPPIRQRLKPLIPFFITWTVVTSLAVHLLRERKSGDALLGRAHAKETVLEALVARFTEGEVVPDIEIRRELEMVGLREKLVDVEVVEARKIGWGEMMLGRKREITEAEAEEEWRDSEWGGCSLTSVVKNVTAEAEASQEPKAGVGAVAPGQAPRTGVVRRAESDKAFL